MAAECRRWSEPVVFDAARTMGNGVTDLMVVPGHFNCYEIYINAPQAWLDVDVTFELSNEDVAVGSDNKAVRDIERPTFPNGGGVVSTAAGRINGLLWQSKGIAADKLRVIARAPDAVSEGVEARVVVRAWADPGLLAGGRMARQNVDLFAQRHQQLNLTLQPVGGVNVVLAALPNGERFNVTRISHSVAHAVQGLYLLRTRNPTTAVTTSRSQWIGGDAGLVVSTFIEHFTYPMRPDRGDSWELVSPAGAVVEAFNMTGYVE